MDKEVFLRLESSLRQIKTTLLSDAELRKLLYYSSEEVKGNLEDMKDVTIAAVEGNIYLQLVVDLDTKPPFDKRNYLSIYLSSGSRTDEDMMIYGIAVQVGCEKHDWNLKGRVRPLLIVQKIINLLDNQKFDLSHPLEFNNIDQTIVNDDVIGYAVVFAAGDGAHEKPQS